ncbi:Ig-like domain-containing protein [Streptomyces sp. NPDC047022]|uniref:Ig-like domain-containing protein n=1 Tax=Streptomyces sp. NPDC047022 TaxID=3155737 RepID=UPI00340770E3
MKQWQKARAWKPVTIAAVTALATFSASASAAQSAPVPSTTTVRAIPPTPVIGQPTNLEATVTCSQDVTGGSTITFFDGPHPLGTIPVNAAGMAIETVAFAAPGPHTITAFYSGNPNCSASFDTTTVNVSPASACPPRKPRHDHGHGRREMTGVHGGEADHCRKRKSHGKRRAGTPTSAKKQAQGLSTRRSAMAWSGAAVSMGTGREPFVACRSSCVPQYRSILRISFPHPSHGLDRDARGTPGMDPPPCAAARVRLRSGRAPYH